MKEIPKTLYGSAYSSQKKSQPTRSAISAARIGEAESERRHEERFKEKYAKYGTGRLISEGTIARLSGVPYPNLNKVSQGDAQSFHYGYYDRGNTNLIILIGTGSTSIPLLTDNITKVYQEINRAFGLNRTEMPYEKLEENVKYNEILRVIGFTDGKNPEIVFENLDEAIKNCPSYKEGYELGKKFKENVEYQKTTSKGVRK